jgi:hypothetical protein
MARGRLGTALQEVGRQAVRRVTHSEAGHVTARRAGVHTVPDEGSQGTHTNGRLYWVAGMDTMDDESKVF